MNEQLLSTGISEYVTPPRLLGTFTKKTDGYPRFAHTFDVIGDEGFSFGGAVGAGSAIDVFTAYNFKTDTWRTIDTQSKPAARYGAASCVINGKLYIFGGNGSAVFRDSHVYDPETNEWAQIAALPSARYYHTCVAINGRAYIFAGFSGTSPLQECLEYDPLTDTYSAKNSGMGSRHAHGAVAWRGNMYTGSGVRVSTGLIDLIRYNTADNTAISRASFPAYRTYFGLVCIGDHIYQFGGSQNGTTSVNAFHEYSIIDNQWKTLQSGPSERYVPKMVEYDGKAWMYGGRQGTTSLGELWLIE